MSEPTFTEAETPVREPIFRAPMVVLILIVVLALIHLAVQLAGESWRNWSFYEIGRAHV